jgi:pimeloyl-ACP methyl ester carboxylesterase
MVLNSPQAWIFLRGLTRECGHWGSFVQTFEALVPGSHVVCVDIPGNGSLFKSRSSLVIHEMMESCRYQLHAMGVEAPYRLFGMSMGAMIAVSWCSAFPSEVDACVLINASMKPFSAFYERLRPANYFQLFRLAVLQASDEDWERAILLMTSTVKDQSVLPGWLDLRCKHPVSRLNAIRQLWAASQYSAPPRGSGVPTLVLTSEGDELVASACSYAIARHCHWPVRIHPHAGHDLPLDDGAWVADQVNQWLNSSEAN